jgi:predicted nuclease with RNAse H fold
MLIAGVDLAAEPQGTALAVIEWSPDSAKIIDLQLGVTDEPIVQVSSQVTKLGIDCALGWPQEFVNFMTQQADVNLSGHDFDGGMDWRRTLAYRETDRNVREQTGRWPLSVSTDRLGLTAMRCAGLLSRLKAEGVEIDRSGTGLVAEVYPGASLRLWGFDTKGYRASMEIRANLLDEIQDSVFWLNLGGYAEKLVASCDAFDAFIAALTTRAVALGNVNMPNVHQLEQARVEGWINLPNCSLQSLIN